MSPIEAQHALISKLVAAPEAPILLRGRRQFGRGGPLQPAFLVWLLLSLVRHGDRRGYARMLESFWGEARSLGLELPRDKPVSPQAFSDARSKLPSQVVQSLLHGAADEFDRAHGEDFRWRGRRLLAVDGARRFVRRSCELRRRLGCPEGARYPQIHVTTVFDVSSQVPLDAVVGPYGSDERRQLLLVLDRVRPGDILVLDRGYPAFDILSALTLRGIDFVVRVPASSTFKAVEEFLATGRSEGVIELLPPDDSPMRDMEPLRVRIVVVPRRGESPWVLLTSLPATEFSAADIADAYTRRWRIEMSQACRMYRAGASCRRSCRSSLRCSSSGRALGCGSFDRALIGGPAVVVAGRW